MKRCETLETLWDNADLSFAEKVLKESYHAGGSRGRPPRSPLGIFKAHLLRRLRHIPSDRMLTRLLWKDQGRNVSVRFDLYQGLQSPKP